MSAGQDENLCYRPEHDSGDVMLHWERRKGERRVKAAIQHPLRASMVWDSGWMGFIEDRRVQERRKGE